MRVISTWSPDEVPATTVTDYIRSTGSVRVQQAFVTPPVALSQVQDTGTNQRTPSGSTQQGAALPVIALAVSESPYRAADGSMLSEVSVSFTPNPADTNFDHVSIWFTGYNGNPNFQLMTEGNTSPISFLCQTTHETVKVIARAVSSTGAGTSLTDSPAVIVALDGVTSAPPPPAIVQTLTPTPTGYQFQFQQVGGLGADQILSYQVFRSNVNNFATAVVIKTYPQSTNATTGFITVQDNVPNGQTWFYWVVAVNTSGLSSPPVAAQTGSIANGSKLNTFGQLINADQVAADGATFARILTSELQQNHLPGAPSVNNIANPCFSDVRIGGGVMQTGKPCMDWTIVQNDNLFCNVLAEVNVSWSPTLSDLAIFAVPNILIPNGFSACVVESSPVSVKAGDVVCAGFLAWVSQGSPLPAGVEGRMYADVMPTDCNGNVVGTGPGGALPGADHIGQRVASGSAWDNGGFVPFASVYTVPINLTNLAFVKIRLVYQLVNSGAPINMPGNVIAVRFTNLYLGQAVNAASPQVAKYGSMPPIGGNPLSFSTSPTAIHFNGTFTGYRTDNNLAALSGGYDFNNTGLSGNTKYFHYPYWDDNVVNLPGSGANPQSLQFAHTGGGSGSLGISFLATNNTAMQFVVRSDHIPLGDGPIAITTPSSGTGGGSGGGGGGAGTCPRSDMLVRHRELGVISAGELLFAFRKGGEHYIESLNGWTRVIEMDASERTEWATVDFGVDKFIGTPYHAWPTDKGEIPSCELDGEQIDTTEGAAKHCRTVFSYESGTAIKITVEEPNVYLCGAKSPSLQTHNMMIPC